MHGMYVSKSHRKYDDRNVRMYILRQFFFHVLLFYFLGRKYLTNPRRNILWYRNNAVTTTSCTYGIHNIYVSKSHCKYPSHDTHVMVSTW